MVFIMKADDCSFIFLEVNLPSALIKHILYLIVKGTTEKKVGYALYIMCPLLTYIVAD